MRALILVIALMGSLLASVVNTGDLTVVLLEDGKPLANQEVVLFKKHKALNENEKSTYEKYATHVTDEDGYVSVELPTGEYKLHLFAKSDGVAIAFLKKKFLIKRDKESQIILSLKKDKSLAFVDTEVPEVATTVAVAETKTKQKGSLLVNITSEEDAKPVKGARVFVQGQSVDLLSKADGSVSLELPEGEYTMSIIHSDYSTQTLKVKVKAKELSTKYVELSPSSMELEEFVVLAPHVGGSISSIINEKRNSAKVEDIIGSDQMSKSGDSNAASALKRLSGVTIVDGSIFVRGLGERYTTATMNGLSLPSPEPTKRVVPLSLFPAQIIDSISVQKTYSADMPAQFGGGAIDIRTKNIPDDFFMNAKVETTYNDLYSGETGASYEGGGSDWTGADDGTRKLNNFIKDAPLSDVNGQPGIRNRELSAIMALNKLATHEKEIPLSGKMSLSVGDKFVGSGYEMGYTAAYSYENKWDKLIRERAGYNAANGELLSKKEYSTSESTRNTINHSAMFGFGLDLGQAHSFKSTTFYAKNTTDITKLTDKVTENDDHFKDTYLSWVERDLILTQLEGEHRSAESDYGKLTFNWAGDIARAERYEPATREYSYKFNNANQVYLLNTTGANQGIDYEYRNNELTDDVYNLKSSLKHELEYSNGMKTGLEVGVYRYEKERESDTYRYTYAGNQAFLSDVNVMSQGIDSIVSQQNIGLFLLNLQRKIDPSAPDSYQAKHTIDAVYFSTDLMFSEAFSMNFGVRKEDSRQTTQVEKLNVVEENELVSDENFPAINATYKFGEGMQLRAGYGKSISRPDFREFIPSSYYDDNLDVKVQGNADLTYSLIDSYDIRYEWYFSPTEMISFGAFYKEMENPIETVLDSSAEGVVFTFENAKSAELRGLELDFRKNFAFIDPRLENYFFAGNGALIDSEVELDPSSLDGQGGILTTNNREMQGQSPYVVNVQLGYDNADNGRSVSVLYNRAGERIRSLGVSGQPDVYEQPFDQLDFVWIEEFSYGLSIKFRVKNILDEEVLWTQDDKPVNQYKIGRDYTFALNWKY